MGRHKKIKQYKVVPVSKDEFPDDDVEPQPDSDIELGDVLSAEESSESETSDDSSDASNDVEIEQIDFDKLKVPDEEMTMGEKIKDWFHEKDGLEIDWMRLFWFCLGFALMLFFVALMVIKINYG